MKKLLTLFTLLLTVCSGAWGETVVWESDMQETITGVTQTKGRANDTWTANTGLAWASDDTYPSRFNCGGSSSALTLQFDSPLSLHANYAIRVYWGSTKDPNNRTLSLTLNTDASPVASQVNLKNTVRVLDYELSGDVTLSKFKVAVSGDNCYIFKVSIVNLEGPSTGETTVSFGFIKGTNIAEGITNNRIKSISGYSTSISTSTLAISSNNSVEGYCGQITGQSADYSANNYVELQFTVADGYTFTPSSTSFKFRSNNASMKAKVSVMDATTTVTSNESSGSANSNITITFADGAFTSKVFTGTVHLRVYLYGVASQRAYLASPFTITGTVASAAPATKYDVTYKANGSGEDDVEHNVSTVEDNMFTWAGHTFTGWNTEYDGSGDPYAAGDAVTEDLTLWAQWLSDNDATFSNGTYIIGGSALDLSTLFTSSSDGAVTYTVTNVNGTGATIDGTSFTATTAGTATVKASQVATSTYAAKELTATITVATDPLGTNKTITWTLSPLNSSDATLTSTSVSSSIYLKNVGEINHTKVSLNSTPTAAKNRTAKIDRTENKDNNKYIYVTFDVQNGYYFIPTNVSIKVANVSTVTTFDAELVDEHNVSVGETGKSFSSTDGTVETWNIANSDKSKKMSGTVTLKIYGYAETAGTYRFGNQFVITGSVIPQPVSATIPSSGWGSYCSPYALDFSDANTECEAYVVSAYDVDNLTITYSKQTGIVPAGTGILLKGDAGATSIVVSDEAGSAPAVNKLVGFTAATEYTKTGDNRYLGLSGGNWKEMNAGAIPANKAVLEITAAELTTLQGKLASGDAKFTIILDDEPSGETDGIRSVENGELRMENYDYYNLSGQRVGKDYKGIVIVNGKKYLRK